MSNVKAQISNQIQSSNDMPKTLDPEPNSEPDLVRMESDSEIVSGSYFEICYSF
jgi:hypothetical protein